MNYTEHALVFNCGNSRLLGINTQPASPAETGVLIVVGGPQYRSGSHRQFTLLARYLAEQGYPSLRFDYRGMGDSEGEARNFEGINADLRAAIDSWQTQAPGVRHVVIWGLCDAASAALYYAHSDSRVSGLVLLNPWVHSVAGAASTRLKHYYLTRLMQRSFWLKLLSGKVELRKSAGELSASAQSASKVATSAPADPRHGSAGYVDRMLAGLEKFQGEVLILLSGNDLVAQEFITLTRRHKQWKQCCSSPKISREIIPEANHTFSSKSWREQVACRTAQWLARQTEHL